MADGRSGASAVVTKIPQISEASGGVRRARASRVGTEGERLSHLAGTGASQGHLWRYIVNDQGLGVRRGCTGGVSDGQGHLIRSKVHRREGERGAATGRKALAVLCH